MIISEELLLSELSKFNIVPDKEQITMLNLYARLLMEWNEKFNLTAIISPDDIVLKHFVDSLTVLSYGNFKNNSKIIDVGTGAGFPGLPLIIMKKGFFVTFLDSTGKKINFINAVLNELSIEAETIVGRAEEYAHKEGYRENYDFATARAVSELRKISELCLPFVKTGGEFIAMKGAKADEEVKEAENAIITVGGKIERTEKFYIDSQNERNLIFIKKISQTSTKYPRNYSQIVKHPL